MARQEQWKLQRLKKKSRTDLEVPGMAMGQIAMRDWEH